MGAEGTKSARDENELSREILRRVREVEIRTRRNVEELLAGKYHSAFRGRGIELHELREYYVSDDVRDIDWNVTARFGRPFVKTYVEERELTVIIVADVSASMSFGTGKKSKREAAAEVTALLALSAVRNDDQVGLILSGPGGPKFVPARKRRPHALRLVREVLVGKAEMAVVGLRRHLPFASAKWSVRLPMEGAASGLKEAFETILGVEKRRAVVVVLSDFEEDSSNWLVPARLVSRRHDLIFGLVYDRREAEPPATGLVELLDPETGGRILLDPSDSRTARMWKTGFERHRNSVNEIARRIGAEVIELDTSADPADAVAGFFRQRSRRRR